MKTAEMMALAGILAALNAWAMPADGLHPNSDSWPWAEIVKRGRIGLQGKHQGASTFFRNLRVKEGDCK